MAAVAVPTDRSDGAPEVPGAALTTRRTALLVAAGGGAGSAARYAMELLVPSTLTPTLAEIPWATWTVNVLGCLMIGIVVGALEVRPHTPAWVRPLLAAGFCGGFTTLSTLVLQLSAMTGAGFPLLALEYGLGTAVLAIVATIVGLLAGRTFGARASA